MTLLYHLLAPTLLIPISAQGAAPREGLKPWFYGNPLLYSKHYMKTGRGESSPLVKAAGDPSRSIASVNTSRPCCKGCRYGDMQCAKSCTYDKYTCRNNSSNYQIAIPKGADFLQKITYDQCSKHKAKAFANGCSDLCQRFISDATSYEEGHEEMRTHDEGHEEMGTQEAVIRVRRLGSSSHDVVGGPTMHRNNAVSQSDKCSKKCLSHVVDRCQNVGCHCDHQLGTLSLEELQRLQYSNKLVYTYLEVDVTQVPTPQSLCIEYGLAKCSGSAWPQKLAMIW